MKDNPSYDPGNDLYHFHSYLKYATQRAIMNPMTFLNAYLPLRMHTKTRDAIEVTVRKYKPECDFIFGLILAESTVVAVIKKEAKLIVQPAGKPLLLPNSADVHIIQTYIASNKTRLQVKNQSVHTLCMPGLAEDLKMSIFIHLEQYTNLRIVYVSEDETEA